MFESQPRVTKGDELAVLIQQTWVQILAFQKSKLLFWILMQCKRSICWGPFINDVTLILAFSDPPPPSVALHHKNVDPP